MHRGLEDFEFSVVEVLCGALASSTVGGGRACGLELATAGETKLASSGGEDNSGIHVLKI